MADDSGLFRGSLAILMGLALLHTTLPCITPETDFFSVQ